MIKKIITRIGQTFNSASTWSNLRFNVTWVNFTVCLCLVIITLAMCWMFHKRYVSGAEITAFAVVIIGYGSVAFGYKNAQSKIENQPEITEQKKEE